MTHFDTITSQIKQSGPIPFVDFMQRALYAPNTGYYTAQSHQFGAEGDFITAPELTPLFGHALANQCQQVFRQLTDPVILEFGAGSGQLCVDILSRLETLNALPLTYYILDLSSPLQQRQRDLIHKKIPHLASRVQWLSRWPSVPFQGVILANEVLDAMPVHRFLQTETGVLESYVRVNAEGELCEDFLPCVNERLIQHVQAVLPAGLSPYQSEANLFIDDWVHQCFNFLDKGAVFLIDYGFPRHEYYHPDRQGGTLMCHYRHQAHPNALLHVGEQDITAHVDMTHVAEAAVDAGFHVAGYTNQAAFLLGNGLLDLLSTIKEEPARTNAQQAVKKLVQPSEMGELFKVIALTKQADESLAGFQLLDKRVSL